MRDHRPPRDELEAIAVEVARSAAQLVRGQLAEVAGRRGGDSAPVRTKSSPTDIVTTTDVASERLIRRRLAVHTPSAGFLGEESGSDDATRPLQWIVDPLDGTVNFWYGLPVVAVSIAAAVDGVVVAAAVTDALGGETFSATLDAGARVDGAAITVSGCADAAQALVTTGFSYGADLRAEQGDVVARLLPQVRDVRCFGSAALQLCWVGCGRSDAYFERDTKVWDYAAAALVAGEGGATVELPCPENDSLTFAAPPELFSSLRPLLT